MRPSTVTEPGVSPRCFCSRSADPKLRWPASIASAKRLMSTAFSHVVTSRKCRRPGLSRRKRFLVCTDSAFGTAASAASHVNTGSCSYLVYWIPSSLRVVYRSDMMSSPV